VESLGECHERGRCAANGGCLGGGRGENFQINKSSVGEFFPFELVW